MIKSASMSIASGKFRSPTTEEMKLCHNVAMFLTQNLPHWLRDQMLVEIEEQLWLKALQTYDPNRPNAKSLFSWLSFCGRRVKAQLLATMNRACRNHDELPIFATDSAEEDFMTDEVAAKISTKTIEYDHPLMDELRVVWGVMSDLERFFWWNLVNDRGNYEHLQYTDWLGRLGISQDDVTRIRNRAYQISLRIKKGSRVQASNTRLGRGYAEWCEAKWAQVCPLVASEESRIGESLRPPPDWP